MSNNFLGLNFNFPSELAKRIVKIAANGGPRTNDTTNSNNNAVTDEQRNYVISGGARAETESLNMLYFNVSAAMNMVDKNGPRSFDMNG